MYQRNHSIAFKSGLLSLIAMLWGTFFLVAGEPKAHLDHWVKATNDFIGEHCLDCHTGAEADGGLDLESVRNALREDGTVSAEQMLVWEKIHDRVAAGEMPPDDELTAALREPFVESLFSKLVEFDREQISQQGRAIWRRMNRFEYENSVRELLDAPWLQLASILPEDGELHHFNKLGEALDVSHVNMSRYLQAAEYALREVMAKSVDAPETKTVRYYAREQTSFYRRVHYNEFNRSPERATFPLLGYTADLDVLRDAGHPFTVGESDPEIREKEAFGVVASSYEPIEIRFSEFKAPSAGRYKLRFKGYTFWTGGEDKKWWRAHRERTSKGRRSEPIAIYSQLPPRQLRLLGDFDFHIEPTVQELDVWLLKGESIQPDAVRLFRSRPPNWHNPLAEKDGIPGVAFNWMEVEGPLFEQWPTRGQKLLFGDMPMKNTDRDPNPRVVSETPERDAHKLLVKFVSAAYRQSAAEVENEVGVFMNVVRSALREGMSFDDAMISAYTAVLCSPKFLCFEEHPGALDEQAVSDRLSLFLWNSLQNEISERQSSSDAAQVDQFLRDERLSQFVNAFLDYWLDLRKINATSPDEFMYPDYYLDDSLVDAALTETRLFFTELIRENLPIRNLIDSEFTFVNERLAKHYDFPPFEGSRLRKVEIPEESERGGLLTQASVLKVTANGSTTSPVVRGAWINDRILGVKIPPPPPSVPAIEPDTRGATTIREQLDRHRADSSCNVCHVKIDPAGFALESFDVLGGFRKNYRSMTDKGDPVPGYGKNGQPFTFRVGPKIDSSGELPDGGKFEDIRGLKELLLKDERQLAKNFVEQLVTYATGAAPRFSDRVEIDAILSRTEGEGYPIRSLIAEVAASSMFLNK